ncbi:hypothetical protein FIV53_00175 [Mycoplasma nasistruthionis]|uniref:Uncharacterized protein n=2 Tax=Mycoplasma nasistruthionis TaxID=353852 RepID=A0A4Y6I572_9MOLU|nr:hypothetical protein FIV53_00175 [Mycoplasma nasistruthionis]
MMKEKLQEVDFIKIEQQNLFYQFLKQIIGKSEFKMEDLLVAFSEEVQKPINKDLDKDAEIELRLDSVYDPRVKENIPVIRMFNKNGIVVENDAFDESEKIISIPLSDARLIDPNISVDDICEIEFTIDDLTDKMKSTVFNGWKQARKEVLKQITIEKYKDKINQKFIAKILKRNNNGSYNLELEDKTTVFLPADKVNQQLNLDYGSYVNIYLENINQESKLSILEATTISPLEIYELLNNEIPEVANGLIEIVNVKRRGGLRTKVSVRALSDSIQNELGSIIGQHSSRINDIKNKLIKEKIDIIKYSDIPEEYVKNALAPAKILDVIKEGDKYFAIAPDDFLTVAIGKKGINTDLASKLTGLKIEVISATDATKKGMSFDNTQAEQTHYFKSTTPRSNRSKASERFKDVEFDLETDLLFSEIQNSAIEAFDEINQEKPKAKVSTPKKPKLQNDEVDSLFESSLNQYKEDLSQNVYDFVDDLDKYSDDENFDQAEQEEVDKQVAKAKKDKAIEQFRKIKTQIKDFKVDNDLANYGLGDADINFDEFKDEEWD